MVDFKNFDAVPVRQVDPTPDGDALVWNETEKVWENNTLTAADVGAYPDTNPAGYVDAAGAAAAAPVQSVAGRTGDVLLTSADISGTTTNDDATAGDIGEVLSASLASGDAISLTTGDAANVVSITLTAGDWDVQGAVTFNAGLLTSLLTLSSSVSSTTETIGGLGQETRIWNTNVIGANTLSLPFPQTRFKVANATTLTIYMVAYASFSLGALSAYGSMYARRAR